MLVGNAATLAALTALIGVGIAVPAIDPELKPSKPSKSPLTYVDTSLDKYDRFVLTVDGKPFFYNGVQIRVDKTHDVWGLGDEDNKRLFQTAADDGFTVINSQIRWTDIQPDILINASESTWIQGGSKASTNFASEDYVKVGYKDNSQEDQKLAYFKFDFSDYPHKEIHAARLRIRVNADTVGEKSFSVNLFGITNNDWDASKITWNSGAPNHKGVEISGKEGKDYFLVSSSPSWDRINGKQYYDFDCSDFITKHTRNRIASFILQADSKDVDIEIGATIDGADGAKPPQLILSNENEYSWTYLDKMLKWSEEVGVKFEIIWFGTDTVGTSMESRVPHFALRGIKTEKISGDGHVPAVSKHSDPAYGVYWYLLDKNDLTTRAKEKRAIKTMLNHVADYNAKNGNKKTLIGVDVANEPMIFMLHGTKFTPWQNPKTWGAFDKFDSVQGFIDRTMWEYTMNLANAVKESKYPVWTRVNDITRTDAVDTVGYNEARRKDEGTSIDFIGLDPYTKNLENAYKFGHGNPFKRSYTTGLNVPMIAENGGEVPICANLDLATIAGGGIFNVYDIYSTDRHGLYVPGENNDYKNFQPRGPYVEQVRKTNNLLKKISWELASKKSAAAGGEHLTFLNTLLDGKNTTSQVKDIGIKYSPADAGTSVGISIGQGERKLTVASTGAATFQLSGIQAYGIKSLESGSYKGTNWAVDSSVAFKEDGEDASFEIKAYEVIRLVTKKPIK